MPTERQQAKRIVNDLERVVERVVRELAVNITSELTRVNPVDTGWSKSNWIPSVGASVSAAPGSPENIGPAVAAQARGRSRLRTYRLRDGRAFISNNAPYITQLNEGRSPQAEAGWVQRSIFAALSRLKSLRIRG